MESSTQSGVATGTVAAAVALGLTLLMLLLLALLNFLNCFIRNRSQQHTHSDCRSSSCTPSETKAFESQEDPAPLKPSRFPFYAHGVLQAPPANYLLSVPNLEAAAAAPSFDNSDKTMMINGYEAYDYCPYKFVRISNPIYDGIHEPSGMPGIDITPFTTPGTSPSCLELDNDEDQDQCSPPLSVMQKLPAVLPRSAVIDGVCLVEGRSSLAVSASGTTSDTNRLSSSSCYSGSTLCYSP